jgi:hypothetical protein
LILSEIGTIALQPSNHGRRRRVVIAAQRLASLECGIIKMFMKIASFLEKRNMPVTQYTEMPLRVPEFTFHVAPDGLTHL